MTARPFENVSLRSLTIAFAILFLTLISSVSIALLTLSRGTFSTFIALSLAILSWLAVPLAWWAFRSLIYRPIQDIYHQISAFRKSSDQMTRQNPTGSREIRKIGEAFNELKESLKNQREIQIQFLASVAHDLRNPLGAIQNASELLAEAKDADPEQKTLSQIIIRQTHQLDRLVGDILEASRIESGRLELQKREVDLVGLIADSVLLHEQVSAKHQLVMISNSASIIGLIDRDRIGQAINNLLSNAIKYSPEGGSIEVSVEKKNSSCLVSVSDPGIGIDPEEIEKIFEPFHRTKLSSTNIPGVGLGLSVTKKIIEAHEGKIWVESNPGQGSKFCIQIPLGLNNQE